MNIVSMAYAQAAPGGSGFDFLSLLPPVLIVVVLYFFLIRPQQKKAQQRQSMLNILRRGDKVVTNGGIVGVITKAMNDDKEVQVEIAPGIVVSVIRTMIADVISKDAPFEQTSSSSEKKEVKITNNSASKPKIASSSRLKKNKDK